MQEIFGHHPLTRYSKTEIIPVTTNIYVLESGVVGLYAVGKKTKKLIFMYKAGEIFPVESPHSYSSGRTYQYIAMSQVKVRSYTREDIAVRLQNDRILSKLFAGLNSVTKSQTERIDNLQEDLVQRRLLERLVYVAQRFGEAKGEDFTINVLLSHVDLASSIGVSRETVNRYMKYFEREGLLKVTKQRIRLLRFKQLVALAHSESPIDLERRTLRGGT